MKAAVWHAREDVRIENIPEPPSPGPGEVKIKVGWCGICGTDLHEYHAGPIFTQVGKPHPLSGKMAPLVPGHEFAGTIVEVGKGVKSAKVGDRVAVQPILACWECAYCLQGLPHLCTQIGFLGCHGDGAFAEYVNVVVETGKETVPLLYKLPEGVSLEAGALVEPLSVAIKAAQVGELLIGENVVVVGAGPIGLCQVQVARAAGAKQIIVMELAGTRRQFALNMGATTVVDPASQDAVQVVKDLTDGLGADCAFECVGAEEPMKLCLASIRKGGRVVVVGIFEKPALTDYFDAVFFDKTIKGSFGHTNHFRITTALLADGRLKADPLITGRIGLDDLIEKGFEELLAHKERNVKIIVSPTL
jgi:(R,R)-butanediol dehydrogenase/meso-butanediol dehydrogenase/diacetyl reductase